MLANLKWCSFIQTKKVMKKLLLASTSTLYGEEYLNYLLPHLKIFFNGIKKVTFIPYAMPGGISYDNYTERAKRAFAKIDISIQGIHEGDDPLTLLNEAEGIFTGGGNTFLLVKTIYQHGLMESLRKKIFAGLPYMGTSAGSNIAGVTMQNTNDMPIVYPPSFKTLGAIPFNINAHYLDPVEGSVHMGETRETRIKEYHVHNTVPVVGLREGSWLLVNDEKIMLQGEQPARIFIQGRSPYELSAGVEVNIEP